MSSSSSTLPIDADWTTSEICYLSAGGSAQHSIHKQLLEEKSELIASAVTLNGRSNEYEFDDTSEITIARSIKWAYSGDYTGGFRESAIAKDSEYPFMALAHLYLFANTYLVEDLRKLARRKLTSAIRGVASTPRTPSGVSIGDGGLIRPTDLNSFAAAWKRSRPKDIASIRSDAMEPIIELLKFCFSGVFGDDDALLIWLGQFVAWASPQFSTHPKFKGALPQVCRLVFNSMLQAPLAPWQCGLCAATTNDDCCFYCAQSPSTVKSRNISQASTIGNNKSRVSSLGESYCTSPSNSVDSSDEEEGRDRLDICSLT